MAATPPPGNSTSAVCKVSNSSTSGTWQWGGKGYLVMAWADAWARLRPVLEQRGVRPFVGWVRKWELYVDSDSREFRHALGAVAVAWERLLETRREHRELDRIRSGFQ